MRNKVAKALRRMAVDRDTPYKVIKKLYRNALRDGTVADIGKRAGLR